MNTTDDNSELSRDVSKRRKTFKKKETENKLNKTEALTDAEIESLYKQIL